MAKIETKHAKKIGLISAISMLIGSTIGVGIFFKNDNVFLTNNQNAIGVLIAWIISGLISICTAFCFAEVGSSKQSHSGLGGWYETIVNKKAGNFIKIIQPLFYFMIIAFAIAVFCAESIFNIFNFSDKLNFGIIMLIGIFIFIAFLIFNMISMNISAKFQVVVSILKFVPLFLVIFAGIIYGALHSENNLFINHPNTNQDHSLSFVSIIISIPSILFAFDSFIGVGNLSLDMKNPKRNVPLAIIIGMIVVTVFYLLVTIGQIMVGKGNIYGVFDLIFMNNDGAKTAMHIILSIFILISILGVLNAFSLIVLKSCQGLYEEKLIMFNKQYEKVANKVINEKYTNRYGLVIAISFVLIVSLIAIIPSSILNTDALIDGISNFPTTIFFGLYGTIVLMTLINRKTNKVKVDKIKFFIPMAIISIIGCYFVSGFQLIYTFFINTILHPVASDSLSWGLFSKNGFITYNWIGTLLMFLYLGLMIIYYLISLYVIKKQNTIKNKKTERTTKILKTKNKNIKIWKEDYD